MPSVDNRVVQMEFDNKQFEKGVAQSLKSLEALKKGLELDKAAASLQNLEKTASKFNLSGIEEAINNIGKHFTFLGRNFDRIVDGMAAKFGHFIKSISTDQVSAGMAKYETQTKAVQTIMNATGKEIGDVEKVLDDLMKYTDETSYDFSTMAESIGKFTSVGVDLAKAEKAMEGIANEAAMSGAGKAEANRAMYNFAQALSAGYVKLIDWKSIENANMATKSFKEELIKTAIETGTLNKVTATSGTILKGTGKKAKKVTVDFKSFNETLSDKWLTSDVLIKTLERYADRTGGIGKQAFIAAQKALTFSDAMDAIKDAVSSGWMQSFKYMFGNLEEAMDLWTGFCNGIIEFTSIFSEARNEILKAWHEQNGYNAAIEAASNLWGIFMNVVNAVKDAFEEVFLVTDGKESPFTILGNDLAKVTERFRDATKIWREALGYDDEVTIEEPITKIINKADALKEGLKKGFKGKEEVKALQKELVKLGLLETKGVDGIFGSKTEAALKALQKQLGVKETGIWDANTKKAAVADKRFQEVTKDLENLQKKIYKPGEKYYVDEEYDKVIDKAEKLKKILQGGILGDDLKKGDRSKEVKELQQELIRLGLLQDKAGADGIFGSHTQDAIKKLQKKLGVKETGMWDANTRKALKTTKVFETTEKATRKVEKVVESTTDPVERLQRAIRGVFSAGNIFVSLISFGGKVLGYFASLFSPLIDSFLTIAAVVGDCIDSLRVFINESGLLDKWFESVKTFLGPVGTVIDGVASAINNFFSENKDIKTFTDLWGALDKKLNESYTWLSLKQAFRDFGARIKEISPKIKELFGTVKKYLGDKFKMVFDWVVANFPKAITIITNFFVDLYDYVSKSDKIQTFWAGFKKTISGVATVIKELAGAGFEKIKDFLKIGQGGESTDGEFRLFDFIKSKFEGFKTWLGDKKNGIGEAIQNTLNNLKLKHPELEGTLERIKGLGEKIKRIFGKIKTAISEFFGGEEEVSLDPLTMSKGGGLFLMDKGGNTSFVDKIKKRLEAFNPVLEEFSGIGEKLKSLWESIIGVFSSDKKEEGKAEDDAEKTVTVFDTIVGFFKKLSDFGWGKLLIGALGAWAVFTTIKSIKNIGGAFKNISEIIKNKFQGGDVVEDGPGEMMLKIAESVAIIAIALGLFSQLDAKKAWGAVAIIGTTLVILGGVMFALTKFGDKEVGTQALMLTGSIVVLAIGIFLMMKVVEKALVKPGPFIGAMAIILLLLAALGFIEYKIRKAGGESASEEKGASSVLQMCAGLILITFALSRMTKLVDKYISKGKGKTLLISFGMIALLIAGLGAIEILIAKNSNNGGGKTKVGGMMGMATALRIIVSSFGSIIKMVQKYGSTTAWQAFAMIEILVLTLGAIAILISKFSNPAGAAVSAVPILAMGLVISQIVHVFKEAIMQIKDVNPELLKIFFIGIEAAMAILAGVVLAFGNMPVAAFIGSAGLVAVMAALAAGIAIIAEVGSNAIEKFGTAIWIIGSKLGDYNTFIKDVDFDTLSKVGKFITDDLAPMVKELIGIETGTAKRKATTITEIGSQISIYSGLLKDVDLSTSMIATLVVRQAKVIADLIQTITFSDKYDEGTLPHLGAQISLYCSTLSTAGIDLSISANAKALVDEAKSIADTMSTITLAEGTDTILTGIGGALKLYYQSLEGIEPENVKTVDSKMIKDAFTAISGAMPQDDIDQIKSFATGGSNDMSVLAIGITNLGTALSSYSKDIGGLDKDKVEAANAVLGMIKSIDESLKSFTVGELLGQITGKKDDISSFSQDIVVLGAALSNYANNIGGINSGKVTTANLVIDKVQSLYKSLNSVTWGDLLGILTGKQESIASFGGDMVILGEALSKYGNSVSGLDKGKIEIANDAIGIVSAINRNLPRTGGVAQWFSGEASLGEFASNMSTLGDGIAGYANKTAGADFTNVKEANLVVGSMANMYKRVSDIGSFTSLISILTQEFVAAADDLIDFKNKVSDFTTSSKVTTAIDTVESMVKKFIGLQNSIDWKTTKTDGLESIGKSIRNMMKEIASIDDDSVGSFIGGKKSVLPTVEKVGKSIVSSISSGIDAGMDGDDSPSKKILMAMAAIHASATHALSIKGVNVFEEIGTTITTGVRTGIDNGTTETDEGSPLKKIVVAIAGIYSSAQKAILLSGTNAFEAIGKLILKGLSTGIKEYTYQAESALGTTIRKTYNNNISNSKSGNFETLGKNMVKGLAVGIQKNSWQAEQAFASVVRTAYYAGKQAAQSHSPSRLTAELGQMLDLGLVVGLQSYSDRVSDASSNVVSSAIETAKFGINALSEAILNDSDNVPTIRPVLDLSEIQNGASGIGGLFSGQTVGIRSSVMAKNIAAKDRLVEEVRTGSSNIELASAITSLNERIDGLDKSISNMQVVMDNGALVGQIGPGINRYLGKEYVRTRR